MGFWEGILSCHGGEAVAQVVFVILMNYLEVNIKGWQRNNFY